MNYITDINDLNLGKTYTYADYLTWRFKERVELLWGKVREMTAAPSTLHQKVLGSLHLAVGNRIKNTNCQVFIAPFDVRLPVKGTGSDIINVVQPDLCVVCDERKIDDKGCLGAPDLVAEVLSPSTSTRDAKDKLRLYEQAGVPEYWVVDPYAGIIHKYILASGGKYQSAYPVTAEDEIISETIPGLVFSMQDVFPDILKEPEAPYGTEVRRW